MDNTIIIEVAKRTKTEVIEQLKEAPLIAAPLAITAIFTAPFLLTIFIILISIAYIAYSEYKSYEQELIMNDLNVHAPDPLGEEDTEDNKEQNK